MNDLIIKKFEGRNITTVILNGEPHWIAKDICEILGLSNPTKAIANLKEGTQKKLLSAIECTNLKLGHYPNGLNVVTEPGLYKLIFKSRKPEAERFSDWVAEEVLPEIRKTGSYNKPQSIEDLIILQAQSVKEVKRQLQLAQQEIASAKAELDTVKHRIDNIDNVNLIGDLRQRLNAMVRKYAREKGINYGKAWNEFKKAFNTAYHTNLELCMTYTKKKYGLKDITIPQYLSIENLLEDAIRVADKMLNN